MTGDEFKALRCKAGLSYRVAAEQVGVALSSIQRAEHAAEVPADLAQRMQALADGTTPQASTALVLGRVFALLEHAANKRIPHGLLTLVEANPTAALGQYLGIARATRPDAYHELEDAITQAVAQLPTAISPLGVDGMGSFWIGYYHQRAELR